MTIDSEIADDLEAAVQNVLDFCGPESAANIRRNISMAPRLAFLGLVTSTPETRDGYLKARRVLVNELDFSVQEADLLLLVAALDYWSDNKVPPTLEQFVRKTVQFARLVLLSRLDETVFFFGAGASYLMDVPNLDYHAVHSLLDEEIKKRSAPGPVRDALYLHFFVGATAEELSRLPGLSGREHEFTSILKEVSDGVSSRLNVASGDNTLGPNDRGEPG